MVIADEKNVKLVEYSSRVFELKKAIPNKKLETPSITMHIEFRTLMYLNSTNGDGRLIPKSAKICWFSFKIFIIVFLLGEHRRSVEDIFNKSNVKSFRLRKIYFYGNGHERL